ncbi:MAG: subtilisin family serine protease [Candidatus Marinamargulisbacteria bacterium]|jgi:subtilisin family serine protease
MKLKSGQIFLTTLATTTLLVMSGCGEAYQSMVQSTGSNTDSSARISLGMTANDKIIILNRDADLSAAEGRFRAHGASVRFRYNTINGLSITLPEQAADRAFEAITGDADVLYIEDDQIATISKRGGGGKPGSGTETPTPEVTPWGVTRVGGPFSGTGLTAWIIDTGIDLDHPDLNVDTARSITVFTTGKDSKSADDGNGHGTHVAGTIGAIDNDRDVVGVAAGATVVAVKVLSSRGSGSYSGVIAGVDYVATNGAVGDVANMSLGGPPSPALDEAVIRAAEAGIKFALAAGNETDDANNHSPARANHANIFTVSAIDSGDVFAYFSNFGNPPVDVAAPGVSILSLWKSGGLNTISGTSMASPHVAGLLLLGPLSTSGNAIADPDGSPDPIAFR